MHLISLLTANEFYCCKWRELNDPFDFNNSILNREFLINLFNKRHRLLQDPNKLYKRYILEYNHPLLIAEGIDISPKKKAINILQDHNTSKLFSELLMDEYNFRVISFSSTTDKHKSMLMWSHYTAHNGVRMKFEFPDEFKHYFGEEVKLQKVKYDNYFPFIKTEKDLLDSLILKFNDWEYEDEYRIITRYNSELMFNKSYLKEIKFGCRTSTVDIFNIIKLCYKYGYNCEYYSIGNTQMGFTDHYYTPDHVKVIASLNDNNTAAI